MHPSPLSFPVCFYHIIAIFCALGKALLCASPYTGSPIYKGCRASRAPQPIVNRTPAPAQEMLPMSRISQQRHKRF